MDDASFHISFGEDRSVKNVTRRAYFYNLTVTGFDTPLSSCSAIRRIMVRKDELPTLRRVESYFEIKEPFYLRMLLTRSAFGKPNETFNIVIKVNPKAERIRLRGENGCGLFEGRGTVCNPMKQPEVTTDIDTLRIRCQYEVLAPAIGSVSEHQQIRRLIF